MVDADFFVLWFSLLTPLIFSPGPANLSLSSAASKVGYWGAFRFLLGTVLGLVLMTLAVGFGFGSLYVEYPLAFRAVESAGVFYVLYLAYKFFTSNLSAANSQQSGSTKVMGLKDGVLLSLLNGKLFIILTTMFSQFLTDPDNLSFEVLLLTAMFTVYIFFGYSVWMLMANAMSKALKNERAQNIQKNCFASVLALVGLWLLVENVLAWKAIIVS